MLGLSPAFSGVIQDTASTSTLVALICARERATDFALARGGLARRKPQAPRLRVGACAQLGRQGRAARRIRPRRHPSRSLRRRSLRDARRRARRHGRRRPRAGRPADGGRRHRRHDGDDRARSRSPPSRSVARRARPLAPCRRRHGGQRDDPAGMPLDVGRDRRRRQPGGQHPQVARRPVRLLALLRARPRSPDARHVDQPELPALRCGRAGQEFPRLGHPARAAFPGAETCGS